MSCGTAYPDLVRGSGSRLIPPVSLVGLSLSHLPRSLRYGCVRVRGRQAPLSGQRNHSAGRTGQLRPAPHDPARLPVRPLISHTAHFCAAWTPTSEPSCPGVMVNSVAAPATRITGGLRCTRTHSMSASRAAGTPLWRHYVFARVHSGGRISCPSIAQRHTRPAHRGEGSRDTTSDGWEPLNSVCSAAIAGFKLIEFLFHFNLVSFPARDKIRLS